MTAMLFSVSYAGLWGQHALGLEAFIAKAAQLGYPAVEIMCKRPHLSLLDYDDAALDKLSQEARRQKVQIATLAAYNDFTSGPQAAEVPFVEMQLLYIRQIAAAAKKLGAKLIRIFTGYTTAESSADWNKCVKATREAAELAGQFGVTIGVQNHHDVAVGVDAYVEFLDEVDHPNCKAMFDPWSPALHGEDLHKAAKRLAGRMVQTTLADYALLKRYRYLPGLVNYQAAEPMARAVKLGEGVLDLEGFFAGLREGGFGGYVAYEMCSPLRGGGGEANLDAYARHALEKIRKWEKKGIGRRA
jgi:sugar phosphate isomerase/epimerase